MSAGGPTAQQEESVLDRHGRTPSGWNPLRWLATGRHAPPIEDPAEVDRLYRRWRTQVLVSITLGYGFLYTCRLGLSVVKKPLLDAGLFTATELGQIGSAIFYGYAIGKLVNGFLADHADVRKFLALGVLCSALVNLAMGASPMLWVWVALWGINGWFQGFGAPASAVSLSNWFTKEERGRYYGIWSLSHSLGEGLTFVVSGVLVAYWGWRWAFWGPGVGCVALAAGLFVWMKDRPQTLGLPDVRAWKASRAGRDPATESAAEAGSPTSPGGGILAGQLRVLTYPSLWVLGVASATMYISRYAINNWGILYLQEAKGYSLVEAGSILGLNTVAGIFGTVAYGFLSDKVFDSRRPPATLIYGVLETAALAVILFCPPGHPILLSTAFAAFGFTLSGLLAVLGGLFAIDLVPRHATGAAMGMIGAFSYLGAALQDTVTGILLDHGRRVVNGTTHYDFTIAGWFWLGSSVASMLLAASLWRAKAKS
jgi:OPA family sugar phosphate sensor protein UhpC-like MFS transporter